MPLVNIMVNDRAYTVACDEGEEDHLKQLAAQVDAKAREVLGSVGQVGDARMLLMAALLIADEQHEASRAGALAGSQGESQQLRAEKAESTAADLLESAAKKIEDSAGRLVRA
jgi:cell division protein ZapA